MSKSRFTRRLRPTSNLPALLTPTEASVAIEASLSPLPIETCSIADAAGRILREDLWAERDQPPFDRVAMDGIAIATHALYASHGAFRIAGTVAAGARPLTLIDPSTCLEVMTGAVLPPGADAVIPVENITVKDGIAQVDGALKVPAWDNVHRQASDALQGSLALRSGLRLRGPELAAAASTGTSSLQVTVKPRIAVISTGDELIRPGLALEPWQIRRSNTYGILACLHTHGYPILTDDHIGDQPDGLRERLATHLATHTVLILSGGVSAGRFDHVPAALESIGVRKIFHKVAQRPGKPLWFGVGPQGQAVFALPGNPVSTLVCLVRYVLPALSYLSGEQVLPQRWAPLQDSFSARHDLTAFIPIERSADSTHAGAVCLHPTHGSGDFSSLINTLGFAELIPQQRYQPGDAVAVYTW